MTTTTMHPTEAAFQAALDRNPSDHTTRLVFADWLDEQGDPRGPGYRALGVLRIVAGRSSYGVGFVFHPAKIWPPKTYPLGWSYIGPDWYGALAANGTPQHRIYATRREASDAAALAFVLLPPERQAKLLAGE